MCVRLWETVCECVHTRCWGSRALRAIHLTQLSVSLDFSRVTQNDLREMLLSVVSAYALHVCIGSRTCTNMKRTQCDDGKIFRFKM